MARKNCFAFKNGRCEIMEELICDKKKCSFYKSVEKYESDLEKYPLIDYEALYNERHKVEPKKDCFAFKGNGCSILTVCICRKKKHCGFYKTKEQVEQDKIKYPPCDYAALYAERHKDDMKEGFENVKE
jgi:hypothetical protein